MNFKYDYADFFISFFLFMLGELLITIILYVFFDLQLQAIKDSLLLEIVLAAASAAFLNLYYNVMRIFYKLKRMGNIKKYKLVKIQPQYRRIPFNNNSNKDCK